MFSSHGLTTYALTPAGMRTVSIWSTGVVTGRLYNASRCVSRTARIAGQAEGGEILASSLLKELTASAGDIAFSEGREVELKGLTGSHCVFPVAWA